MSKCHDAASRRACSLLAGCRSELDDQFSGYPPAVFHLDALRLGPTPDLDGVQPARWSPAPAAGGPARAAAHPPPTLDMGRQRVPQLPGMLVVQVDLILRAVQPEADSTLGDAAVEVINNQGLDLLGHGRPAPLTGCQRPSVCSLSRASAQPASDPQARRYRGARKSIRPAAACGTETHAAGTGMAETMADMDGPAFWFLLHPLS